MKKIYSILFISIFLVRCSNVSTPGLAPRNVESYYTPTGVEKYFMPDIPEWANFDQRAGCQKTSGIRYFNIDSLMKSYGLNYNKALQIQGAFNEEYNQFRQNDIKHSPTLREEELLFYKVSDKVGNKIIFFDPPAFKRVNIIWIDEVLNDSKKEKKLTSFFRSSVMDVGVPVLLSFCLTRTEMEKRFPNLNAKMITAELMSAFDSKGMLSPGFRIELDQFFDSKQTLYFYSQKNNAPVDALKGISKTLNY